MRIIWSISAILLLSLFCLALNSIGVNQDILKIVGEVTIINGNASGIARYGDHLYMVMNESTRPLLVYDISEPKRPKLLHYLPAPGWPMRCRVIGKWLWTVHGNGEGFFDLTDPANPRFIGIPDINANEGPNLRRLERGKLFIVHPNLTYITCATEDTLFYGYHDRDEKGNIVRRDVQIYDISDPGKPRLLNSLKDAGEPFQLEGKLLFVAKDGIKIYDVSQRDNPNLLTHIQPQMFEQLEKEGFGFASAAAYDEIGKRIFVAIKRGARNFLGVAKGPFEGGESGIAVFDIKKFEKPSLIGWTCIEGEMSDITTLAFHKGHVFASDTAFGLRVFDVTEPSKPKLVASDRQGGECSAVAIIPKRRLLCVGQNITGGVVIVDISRQESPKILGYVHCAPARVWGTMATYHDRYLYFQADFSRPRPGFSGLFSVDLNEPRSPKITSIISGVSRSYGMVVVDHYLYTSGGEIFDLSNPAQPKRLDSRLPCAGYQIVHKEPYLFVANFAEGENGVLYSVDIRNRENPKILGKLVLPLGHRVITAASLGKYLFLGWAYRGGGRRPNGMVIAVDISDPANLRQEKSWDLAKDLGMAEGINYAHVWSDGKLLFVGCYRRKLAAYRLKGEGGELQLDNVAMLDGLPSGWLMSGEDGWIYRICLDKVLTIKVSN